MAWSLPTGRRSWHASKLGVGVSLQVDSVGRAGRPAAPAALSVRGIDHRYLLAAVGRRPAAVIAYRHGAEWAVAHASPHQAVAVGSTYEGPGHGGRPA